MPSGQNSRKAKRENKEEIIEDAKAWKKKNGHLLKKKFVKLHFFSGHSSNIIPQENKLLFEDKRRDLQRLNSRKQNATKEKAPSLAKVHSEKMCPKCKIVICSMCNMLHTESSFIAHCLLDHYDRGQHSTCCSDSRLPQDHHVCKKHATGLPTRLPLMSGLVTSQQC